MGRLTGKVAVVTGGSNGLGEAIAARMTEEDATVAVVDIDKAGGERVAGALTGASFHACDVTNEDEVRAALDAVAPQHGRVDVLVNNVRTRCAHGSGRPAPARRHR